MNTQVLSKVDKKLLVQLVNVRISQLEVDRAVMGPGEGATYLEIMVNEYKNIKRKLQ